MRWREAQDAGLEVRSRIGTPLIDRAHALLLYLDLLRSRQRPRASPNETKMDGRSSDMTTDRRASSPGSPSSESFCRLQYVGINPVSEPGEHQLMPRRPADSTRADGPPRAAIANLSKNYLCPNPMQHWYKRSASVLLSGSHRDSLRLSSTPPRPILRAWLLGCASRLGR